MGSRATARCSAAAALLVALVAGAGPARADDAAPATPIAQEREAAPPPITRTPAGWETLATGLPEEARLHLLPHFHYNRVDGATPGIGAAYRNERDPAPLVYANVSWATGRDRFLGAAGFEAPVGDPTWLRVGSDLYRRTATEDDWIVGEMENTLFALVARTDYRDYYEATGGAARVIWEPGRDVGLEAGVRIQNEANLETTVSFSIFGKEDEFRENPPIEPGDEGLFSVKGRIGPRVIPREGGVQGTLGYERAGGFLERDFDYGRLRASVRGMRHLNARHTARARAFLGSTREGRLPLQKLWHVGGIGTLRGHEYKAFTGDQFFLASAEYMVLVRRRTFPFAFLDWGAAWFGSGNLDRQKPGLDGGLGFRVGEDALVLTVARDLRRSDAPWLVGVRFAYIF
ncbi:MAG TPA: BamA/TamA family outer membrane protein [Candidatus Eisenbacteria bacterium]|nr:BamA/TamA family outer membrane protein [Candidatus Eisenbacteria bacterium]